MTYDINVISSLNLSECLTLIFIALYVSEVVLLLVASPVIPSKDVLQVTPSPWLLESSVDSL